ncbi:DNA ligase D [Amycolatopsis sp. YIM 10]|uniref:DNA ligase D n=1 Tax=Amycolatopsis sp. YIM 10 TaxID=2653857 RepID=UPI00128FCFEA|nr:DNA ligase D [Amycolatopsis sp. YIM 10]QFU85521.1 putative ATP-dependent DNA ligase YkoU [Amycolatopsis sp. YIM 10]
MKVQREPMLATLSDRPFTDPNWIFERKLDGVRALIVREGGGEPQLWSRNQKLMNGAYPEIVEALAEQGGPDFVADGEVVAFDDQGHTSFARLQHRMHLRDPKASMATGIEVFLYVFDLLAFGGMEATSLPLRQRKQLLADAFDFDDPLRLSEHRDTEGEKFLAEARDEGWEGLIAKRADAPYRAGRSSDWLKLKCVREQEVVVGGYTDPTGTRAGFGALLAGYYEGDVLRYAGKIGTGFDQRTLRELHERLRELSRPDSPFTGEVPERRPHWVEPELVVQAGFAEWTSDGRMRHARYLGLRTDKAPREVESEMPALDVKTTRLDKVYYPADGVTKGEVIEHYRTVAEAMLPHLRGRPLTMRRYPHGVGGENWFQKEAPSHWPDWMRTEDVPQHDGGGTTRHVFAEDPATLVYLANQAALEFHIWTSSWDTLDHPDLVVIDIDPPNGTAVDSLREVARAVRELYKAVGLTAYVQATGGRGYHVVAPLDRQSPHETVVSFAREAADFLASKAPAMLTTEFRKNKRGKRIFLDTARNGYAQTFVAPYSLRGRAGARVATPLDWDELGRTEPDGYDIPKLRRRLAQKEDPWQDMHEHAGSAEEAGAQLAEFS